MFPGPIKLTELSIMVYELKALDFNTPELSIRLALGKFFSRLPYVSFHSGKKEVLNIQ